MKAPKCRLCGELHYGICTDSRRSPPVKAARSDSQKEPEISTSSRQVHAGPRELLRRVEEIERILFELLESKRKHSDYMRRYMRDKRGGKDE